MSEREGGQRSGHGQRRRPGYSVCTCTSRPSAMQMFDERGLPMSRTLQTLIPLARGDSAIAETIEDDTDANAAAEICNCPVAQLECYTHW
jgi:hypothetical protein